MISPRSKLDHALTAARHGRVFPLKANAEEPLNPNWQEIAKGLDHEQEIRACWNECPDANVGIVLDDIWVVEFPDILENPAAWTIRACRRASLERARAVPQPHSWAAFGGRLAPANT